MSFLWLFQRMTVGGGHAPAKEVTSEAAYFPLAKPVWTVSRTQVPAAVSAVLM